MWTSCSWERAGMKLGSVWGRLDSTRLHAAFWKMNRSILKLQNWHFYRCIVLDCYCCKCMSYIPNACHLQCHTYFSQIFNLVGCHYFHSVPIGQTGNWAIFRCSWTAADVCFVVLSFECDFCESYTWQMFVLFVLKGCSPIVRLFKMLPFFLDSLIPRIIWGSEL